MTENKEEEIINAKWTKIAGIILIIIGAIFCFYNKEGWGWFLFVGALCF